MWCLAADKGSNTRQILMGTTWMRENAFIFDVDRRRLGYARSKCSGYPAMIQSEKEYFDHGTSMGLIKTKEVKDVKDKE